MKNKILVIALILLALSSCKKDDPGPSYSLDKKELVLVSKGTSQLSVTGATTEVFTYTSKNDLIAAVSTSGLITGKRVGETMIRVSLGTYKDSCKVAVSPLYNTFAEPITSFGLSKAEVKAKEKRTLIAETDAALLYSGSIQEKQVMYTFTDGKLKYSVVILSSAYSSAIGSYMAERYVIISVSPAIGYAVDKSFYVGADLQSNFDWWVLYYQYTGTKSATINSQFYDLKRTYDLIK